MILPILLWSQTYYALEIPVKAAKRRVTALVGTFKNRLVGVTQSIARLAYLISVEVRDK